MKDFLKGALLAIGVLALVLCARVAAFWPLHSEATAVKEPAPIAAADSVRAAIAANVLCFQHTNRRS